MFLKFGQTMATIMQRKIWQSFSLKPAKVSGGGGLFLEAKNLICNLAIVQILHFCFLRGISLAFHLKNP